ncbi:unnamed protein product [Urochloa decumbens]|uniref:F-box domain-containing protein n=1 Tax=Urochloa decumbens TaxID=240449 RepID=A0ABC9GBR0_9POAL
MERPKKCSAVAGLPDDPIVEILSRVPARDLHRSKCVSKGWRDLIADPLHRKKLPQTLHGFFPSYPAESFLQSRRSFVNLIPGSPPPFDPSFACLKKDHAIQRISLLGSCSGLLLFSHDTYASIRHLGYILFNPATEQWAAVPSPHNPVDKHCGLKHTLLVFHPTVSLYFQLVIFCEEEWKVCAVHSYSSKTGVWRHSKIDWAEEVKQRQLKKSVPNISGTVSHATLFNGMLYLILSNDQIAEVDVDGKTQRIISAPPSVGGKSVGSHLIFIGQSQGQLHCINEERWARDIPSELSSRVYTRDFDDDCDLVSIWVLEDRDTLKWVLKHSVSRMRLFGSTFHEIEVVAIHPDSNLVFISLDWKQLISYGLDGKEAHIVGKTKDALSFTPYVPCFLGFLSVAEHKDKLMGCREASSKDLARAGQVSAEAGDCSGQRAEMP